ncbi:Mus7/MMS22 family-domain-containing protein [Xylariomycetidae sp. FL0641]|nr:Mus7/MMS22 family-domain-containing protein [Xylariomycetidae sp. FL0641]
MAKWKELGEVPDSDDESAFDTQESQSELPAQGHNRERDELVTEPAAAGHTDPSVWDVPFSSQTSFKKQDGADTTRSDAPAAPDEPLEETSLAEITKLSAWDIPSSSQVSVQELDPSVAPKAKETAGASLLQTDGSLPERLPSLSPLAEPVEVTGNASGSNGQVAIDLNEVEILTAPPDAGDSEQFEAVSELGDLQDDQDPAGQSPGGRIARLSRSLRPRKPIQEHPYLLESAQYSKTLKSHGVRPLRVRLEEEAARRRQEEDSQEQAYQEESQQTAKDTGQEDTEESQAPHIPSAFDGDELDELANSPERRPSPSPHGERITTSPLSRSSQSDEEEFPDPADIEKWTVKKRRGRPRKRPGSPKASAPRKQPKLQKTQGSSSIQDPAPQIIDDILDVPPSPPQTSSPKPATPMAGVRRSRPVTSLTPKASSTTSSRVQTPVPAKPMVNVIDLSSSDSENPRGPDPESSSTDSDEDPDPVQADIRRIRGVLPASWLRLDQQSDPRSAKKSIQRTDHVPAVDQSHRKGVAQRRQISPKHSNDAALFLDDTDDDERLPPLGLTEQFPDEDPIPIFEDDGASVVEENLIDPMLPTRKRASTKVPGQPKKRRKYTQSTFNGRPHARPRQQRLDWGVGTPKTTLAKSRPDKGRPQKQGNQDGSTAKRTHPPPRLSILDVVEPDVPDFIRIAARTTKQRKDKGRGSPSKKAIFLGTRQDSIDVSRILRNWQEGDIVPRQLKLPEPRPTISMHAYNLPRPLQPTSHNSIAQAPKPQPNATPRGASSGLFPRPSRGARQSSMNEFVSTENETPNAPVTKAPAAPFSHSKHHHPLRPALLEMAGPNTGRHVFHTGKKTLDALYRRSRTKLSAPDDVRLERVVEAPSQPDCVPDDSSREDVDSRARPWQRMLKFRKRALPRALDITAPQYAHANDPLPREPSPPIHREDRAALAGEGGKLLGLGPFGTYYTQHFEVFPLDFGVFFREDTLLGSGCLAKMVDGRSLDRHTHPCDRRTFTLDEKTLSWGSWDAQTSSEFGILFDWILDRMQNAHADLEVESAVRAMDFVLDYLHEGVIFPNTENEKLFAGRALEVLQNFQQRIDAFAAESEGQYRAMVEILARGLIFILRMIILCRKHDLSEVIQLEMILTLTAKTAVRKLYSSGLAGIRNLYHDLQHMSIRERGIRAEQFHAVCWVIIIRVLEEARIPRGTFWDIASTVVLDAGAGSTVDVHIFEQAWRDLFTLLPLGEFDNSGILITNTRHTAPLEGWQIPQRVLKTVFSLYQTNTRQSPTFNDYCRGLVSRCHYLVTHWGWRRCNGIVGTIFDFFATQGLSHLRNEEAYQSPQFLEHLAESPSLAVEPEDRCFHIFLKLLAVTIKKLRELGLFKDVKNLIARVLPNHDRQLHKEKDIHESEVAALRNHHDLLCTLFWAAPVDLRPSVQVIEKLVEPSSSHKEACLVSLRAWSQLARFVISTSRDFAAYRPFADWQKTIFQQVLQQYLSVESDIQQQFLRMSKDSSRNVSQDWKNAVIRMNKKAVMDVLHFSMKAFLGVLQHAPTLATASFAMTHCQLDQAFNQLSFSTTNSDWSCLRVCLDILDYYLKRIVEFVPRDSDASWHKEDAILLLDRKLAAPFFSLTGRLVGTNYKDTALGAAGERSSCIERTVTTAGLQAIQLCNEGLARPSHFFSEKYRLFEHPTKAANAPSRKYVPLFMALLVDRHLERFEDLKMTSLEFFLGELVKPLEYTTYENRLAAIFKQNSVPFLRHAVIKAEARPDYNSNRELFQCKLFPSLVLVGSPLSCPDTITAMRGSLRLAGTGQKPVLQMQYSKALRSTMDRMKLDLKTMALDSREHASHIGFVRSIVHLIRSQDLCPVDSFFYQISPEYSPSSQDPRLQTAGILAWGVKLEEGDTKATSGLFYLVFANFKLALANGKLADETKILEQGMGNPQVFSFMLGTMLPGIVKAAAQMPEAWVFLHTYVGAIRLRMSESCVHREVGRENMSDMLALVQYITVSIEHLRTLTSAELRPGYLVSLTLMVEVLNLFSASIAAFLINDARSRAATEVQESMDTFTDFTRAAAEYLVELESAAPDEAVQIDPNRLFRGVGGLAFGSSLQRCEHAERFASHIVQDIEQNWVCDEATVNVRGPSRPQGPASTQSGRGTAIPRWNARGLVRALLQQLHMWNDMNDTRAATQPNTVPLDDYWF